MLLALAIVPHLASASPIPVRAAVDGSGCVFSTPAGVFDLAPLGAVRAVNHEANGAVFR